MPRATLPVHSSAGGLRRTALWLGVGRGACPPSVMGNIGGWAKLVRSPPLSPDDQALDTDEHLASCFLSNDKY